MAVTIYYGMVLQRDCYGCNRRIILHSTLKWFNSKSTCNISRQGSMFGINANNTSYNPKSVRHCKQSEDDLCRCLKNLSFIITLARSKNDSTKLKNLTHCYFKHGQKHSWKFSWGENAKVAFKCRRHTLLDICKTQWYIASKARIDIASISRVTFLSPFYSNWTPNFCEILKKHNRAGLDTIEYFLKTKWQCCLLTLWPVS